MLQATARLSRHTLQVSESSRNKQRLAAEAKVQENAIRERLEKLGLDPPPYSFIELIGKGSYGRVYKGFDRSNDRLVAVKVLDADAADWQAPRAAKDDQLDGTIHEIQVLYKLKSAHAVNVNQFYEAFQIHSQFWIISEYSSGGSIQTLKRATQGVLQEKHIIAIARELAAGLESVHKAGIVHRDIKCANVMINEKGSLQIIDFGVAGLLESKQDKRSTVIGTGHWMAPELHRNAPPQGLAYGFEVDVWAFGCTLIECATGLPPGAKQTPGRQLGNMWKQNPPRLGDEKFSADLRDLVATVLEPTPDRRPTMTQVLDHEALRNSSSTFPTESLKVLVEEYYRWEHEGGQRASLYVNYGAPRPQVSNAQYDGEEEEDWNFSTTRDFEEEQAYELGILPPDSPDYQLDLDTLADGPDFGGGTSGSEAGNVKPIDEVRVARGEKSMMAIFDAAETPYKYEFKSEASRRAEQLSSDLPLRAGANSSSLTREVAYGGTPASVATPRINLDTIASKKAHAEKRDTMAWKWEDNLIPSTRMSCNIGPSHGLESTSTSFPSAIDRMPSTSSSLLPPSTTPAGGRPPLSVSLSAPVTDRPTSEVLALDLDALMEEGLPSQSTLIAPSITLPNLAEEPTINNPSTFSFPPDGAGMTSIPDMAGAHTLTMRPHDARLSALDPNRSPLPPNGHHHHHLADIPHVNPAALRVGASRDVMVGALNNVLTAFNGELASLLETFEDAEGGDHPEWQEDLVEGNEGEDERAWDGEDEARD